VYQGYSTTQQIEVKNEDLVLSLTNLVQAINKSKADKVSTVSTTSTASPTSPASPASKVEEPKVEEPKVEERRRRRQVDVTKTNTSTQLGTSVDLNPTIPISSMTELSSVVISDGNDDGDELEEVGVANVPTFSVASLRQED